MDLGTASHYIPCGVAKIVGTENGKQCSLASSTYPYACASVIKSKYTLAVIDSHDASTYTVLYIAKFSLFRTA